MNTELLLSTYLAHTADGKWTPGIGDPTFGGWFTVVCYFTVAYLCYANARRLSKQHHPHELKVTWWIITFILVFLGFNKQLDLQSLITYFGRELARSQSWYEHRRIVQAAFIAIVAIGGLSTVLAGGWFLRKHLPDLVLVFVGMTFLVAFIIIRASSFHHVDILIGYRLAGLRMNWILELSGIGLIGLGAYKNKYHL